MRHDFEGRFWRRRYRYRVDDYGISELSPDDRPLQSIAWSRLDRIDDGLHYFDGTKFPLILPPGRKKELTRIIQSEWRERCPRAWREDMRRQARRLRASWILLSLGVCIGINMMYWFCFVNDYLARYATDRASAVKLQDQSMEALFKANRISMFSLFYVPAMIAFFEYHVYVARKQIDESDPSRPNRAPGRSTPTVANEPWRTILPRLRSSLSRLRPGRPPASPAPRA